MQDIRLNNLLKEKWCVIIPTYNNVTTLEKVLSGVLLNTNHIIVVNDGSNDKTAEILTKYSDQIHVITHLINKGKGKSLRDAFDYAISKDYIYAISIDSDGQHYTEDITLFIKAISDNPESLIVGARDLSHDNVPKKSSFGNKFSNFWFWVETGINLTDTQTGFRLYPLNKIRGMHFFTNKFEFEIEVMVRLAWRDVSIKEIPIRVKYDPDERISHFRPFVDFTRISILNTLLFIIALVYFIPLRILYYFFGKENIKGIRKEFISQKGSILQKSASIGFGVFMGIVPIWGFQMLTAVFLSYIFRLNKIIVLLFSNISIPPLLPFILFASYYTGHLIIGGEELVFSNTLNMENFQSVIKQYLFGSIVFAIISGMLFFVVSYFIMLFFKKRTD